MLFPQLGPQYYDEQHKSILSRMETYYATSITIMQAFWSEADTDTRFEANDQTVWSDIYGNLPVNRRRMFTFNRIRRVVQMISGHQRRNRRVFALFLELGFGLDSENLHHVDTHGL